MSAKKSPDRFILAIIQGGGHKGVLQWFKVLIINGKYINNFVLYII
jgi:hypothetical protein